MRLLYVITLISIIVNIMLLGTLNHASSTQQAITTAASVPTHKIAILLPALHPSLTLIENGFKETLAELGLSCTFTEYNANSSKTLMHAQAQEIVASAPDLIFTVGAHASMMVYQLLAKQQIAIPLIFSAVSDPISRGLVPSLTAPGPIATGIADVTAFEPLQVQTLLTFKPNVTQILLVYDPSQGPAFDNNVATFAQLFKQHGITLQPVVVQHHNQVVDKTATALDTLLRTHNAATIAIMILTDHTTVTAVDGLIKLCNNHGVTLFTSELESVDKGAALAFGIDQYAYGKQAALQAAQILKEHTAISTIATKELDDFKIKINVAAAERQGLTIDPQLLFLMRAAIVI